MRRLNQVNNTLNQLYLGYVQIETTIAVRRFEKNGLEWIKINGFSKEETIIDLLEKKGLDPLWIEDVFHVHQRTKIEVNQSHLYFVFNGSTQSHPKQRAKYIQIIVLEDTVISLSETKEDFLEGVFEASINWDKGKSELVHSLVDSIIDQFLELELKLSTDLLKIEEDLLDEVHNTMTDLHQLRKELYVLKSLSQTLVDPLYKKVINDNLVETPIHEKLYNDWFDHIFRLNSQTAEDREMIHQMLDLYNTNLSNKMNSIMKTLTIFSAIFIPLSFLAGVFGMNFTDMSILRIDNGFYWFLGVSALITGLMLLYFKRRDWL